MSDPTSDSVRKFQEIAEGVEREWAENALPTLEALGMFDIDYAEE